MGSYKKNYPDGIGSKFWDAFISPMVKKLKGDKCEVCGSKDNLDIHHLDLDYSKEININNLKVLCKKCHKSEHIQQARKMENRVK